MKNPTDEQDRRTARECFDAAQALRESSAPDDITTPLQVGSYLSKMRKCLLRGKSTIADLGLTQSEVDRVDGVALITYKLHVARTTIYFDYARLLIKDIRDEMECREITDAQRIEVGCTEEDLKQIMAAAAIFEARRLLGEAGKLEMFKALDLPNNESSLALINQACRVVEKYVPGGFEAAFGMSSESIMVLFL